MSAASAIAPAQTTSPLPESNGAKLRVLSLTSGRVRLHFPGWTAGEAERIETELGRVRGVASVHANSLTGNVLIHFDRQTTEVNRLLGDLQEAWDRLVAVPAPRSKLPPGNLHRPPEGRGRAAASLLRVGVRGFLGHAVVDSLWFAAGFLGRRFGLPLTGLGPLHVLVDVAVWGFALGSGAGLSRRLTVGTTPAGAGAVSSPTRYLLPAAFSRRGGRNEC
jgi:hypothetical protein